MIDPIAGWRVELAEQEIQGGAMAVRPRRSDALSFCTFAAMAVSSPFVAGVAVLLW